MRRLVAACAVVGLVLPLGLAGCDAARPDRGAGADTTAAGSEAVPARRRTSPAPPAGGELVVWAHGDLTVETVARFATVPGVTAAAHVRTDTLGLVRAVDRDGRVVEEHTDGYRVPVTVAAVDPASYPATLPTDHPGRAAVSHLRPGQVLLSETGAALRGIGVGGHLSTTAVGDLEVVGVVPDGTVGRAEIVAHADDADALGLGPDGTAYLTHDAPAGPATRAVIAAVEALVPDDLTARVVDVGAGGEDRRPAPRVLSLSEVKARFGEFAYRPREGDREVDLAGGFEDRIVIVEVPLLGRVRCHEAIVADLTAALTEIAARGSGGAIDPSRYAGCFYPRRIRAGDEAMSHHAWGIALDINVDLEADGGGDRPPAAVIAAFERHGFRWGGDFLVPDNHHFEWVGTTSDDPATQAGSSGSSGG